MSSSIAYTISYERNFWNVRQCLIDAYMGLSQQEPLEYHIAIVDSKYYIVDQHNNLVDGTQHSLEFNFRLFAQIINDSVFKGSYSEILSILDILTHQLNIENTIRIEYEVYLLNIDKDNKYGYQGYAWNLFFEKTSCDFLLSKRIFNL